MVVAGPVLVKIVIKSYEPIVWVASIFPALKHSVDFFDAFAVH
jgi:hypothetical protein